MSAHRATDPCRNRGRRATDAGGDRANGARSASHAGRRASTGSCRRHACRAQGDVAADAGSPWHPEGDAAADAVHVHPRRANNPLPRATSQGLSKPCKSWTYADI